ncbi:MAG: hypothetical protein MSA34_03205 [Firmicutes bacterium]|nr:hypothetical protein [Bacillota bacterium]MDY5586119.1 hypothetical protein [Eubacteriales bacterium]
MSRRFQEKNKELITLDVVSSDKVWDKSKLRNGKPTLKKDYSYYGRIDKGSSAFITKTNSTGDNFKFVEDTYKLPKNTKNKIVDLFDNKNKRVVYLVKKKK